MNKIRIWFEAMRMFWSVLLNYQESVVENELTLGQAWNLCYSLKLAKYERSQPYQREVRK